MINVSILDFKNTVLLCYNIFGRCISLMSIKNWTSKRLITCLALFALIFSQISIVKHALQNSDRVFSIAAFDVIFDHDQKHDDKHHSKHKCPECLLTKSFQSALTSDGSFDFYIPVSLESYSFAKNDVVQNIIPANYRPRAPPAFLI